MYGGILLCSVPIARVAAHHECQSHRQSTESKFLFQKWEIPESDLTLETIDLAGQSVYSMTHQFFLVRRSVSHVTLVGNACRKRIQFDLTLTGVLAGLEARG